MKGISQFGIVAIILLGAAIYFGGGLASLSGFTTLSLSQATFQSSNSLFDGEVWVLHVAQDNNGQYATATGSISGEEIGSKSGTPSRRDFDISISTAEQTCEYEIKQEVTGNNIVKFEYKTYVPPFPYVCDGAALTQTCQAPWIYGVELGSFGTQCYCVEATVQTSSIDENLGAPLVHTVSTIQVDNNVDPPSSIPIDTKSNIQGYIGDKVHVRWVGDNVKQQCESASPYFAYYRHGMWYLGYSAKYNDYRSSFISSGTQTQMEAVCDASPYDCKRVINEINSFADQAMGNVYFGSIQDPNDETQTIIKKSLPAFIQIPEYVFTVDADYLIIYQPNPVPDVISATSTKFGPSGGIITTKVKNIGDTGGIDVWAECSAPFAYTSSTLTYSIEGGQTIDVNLPISATSNKPETSTCTVMAQALGGTDSYGVQVSFEPNQQCTPGVETCEANTRYKCDQYGTGKIKIEECSEGYVCGYTSPTITICRAQDNGGGGFNFFGIFDFLNDIFPNLGILLGAFIGVFIAVFMVGMIIVLILWGLSGFRLPIMLLFWIVLILSIIISLLFIK